MNAPQHDAAQPPFIPDASALTPHPPPEREGSRIGADTVLKEGATFLVADPRGDITTTHPGLGLYAHDTRFLNRFILRVGGSLINGATRTQPDPAVTSHRARLHLTRFSPSAITVHRTTVVTDAGMHVQLSLRNTGANACRIPVSLVVAADFRDMFDVRGLYHDTRDVLAPPTIDDSHARFHYAARDGASLWTDIHTSVSAVKTSHIPTGCTRDAPAVRWRYLLDLPANDCAALTIAVNIGQGRETPRGVSVPALLRSARARGQEWTRRVSGITTDHDGMNRLLRRSSHDLRALLMLTAGAEIPAAGIPWFVAPFGRDACITSLQSLMLTPRFAIGTLHALARTQGTRVDPTRDEEPGKIVHEVREGELSRLGLMPHAAYYGSVDSTPLFVMLFAAAMRWLNDDALYRDILPAVRRALAWCDTYGDPDGDGYVEFGRHAAGGVVNQGWKDSKDSLHHPDGSEVMRPVALVEAQGYVYAAKAWLAEIVAARGETAWAAQLQTEADMLAARIERDYWLPEEGTYAYALDRDKRPVRTIVSNAGHLLFTGVAQGARAASVAERLLAPDMRSGWGIRTLATTMTRYDPDSYHNGSIWPHDNSLIALGMCDAGQYAAALTVASEVLQAGIAQPLQRLPELYAGYPRQPQVPAPVPYPVSCAPQAWAAASSFAYLHAMLGLTVDARNGAVTCDPHLPPWLNRVAVHRMRYGQGQGHVADIRIERDGRGGYHTEVSLRP